MIHIDDGGVRREATEIEKKKMDEKLMLLADLFDGSGVRWQLDGAMNISLLRGKYIGVHKDVDVSIESDDCEKLDAHIAKRGYGLFLSLDNDPREGFDGQVMQRVDAYAFVQHNNHMSLCPIDDNGMIVADSPLVFVDVHLIERDSDDNAIGAGGVPLPEQWNEGVDCDFHGHALRLSHPSKVAYYKIHQERSYDMTDLDLLVSSGFLSEVDIDEISNIIELENEKMLSEVNRVVGDVVSHLDKDVDNVLSLFVNHPLIAERLKGSDNVEIRLASLRRIAEAIVDLDEVHELSVRACVLNETKLDVLVQEKRNRIARMRDVLKSTRIKQRLT